ncbi:MAG: sialidase family protein [Chitinophagaceae bacterium]
MRRLFLLTHLFVRPLKKHTPRFIFSIACLLLLFSCTSPAPPESESLYEAGEESPGGRDSMHLLMMRDPALGYVPTDRLHKALDHTRNLKQSAASRNMSFPWTERGPIYDLTSSNAVPFNDSHDAGRIRAILMDTLNDPTGNTVLVGGVSGGLWRCTNFLDAIPDWQPIDDYFSAMCIAYICQDPSQPNVMYFGTGEPTNNADAGGGRGIWKSVDAGLTWTRLPSTVGFERMFRMLCDGQGNIYAAITVFPAGIMRSKDGGNTWTNITPQVPNNNNNCSDLELSSTGRLHASFGYNSIRVYHFYTPDPANATQTEGWQQSTGIAYGADNGMPFKTRMELACLADTLYAVVTGSSHRVEDVYKSVNGGASWTLQNTPVTTAVIAGTQGWYNLTAGINPDSSHHLVIGGINSWISKNSGQAYTQFTFDGGLNNKLVHADHHFLQWFRKGAESWILIGGDGGVYFSRDGGQSFKSKNRNLPIKQFYACALHPAAGSNYMLAGAQDNGTHRLTNPGLSYSNKISGADGGYCHISQLNPQMQFMSQQNGAISRSLNGGSSWSFGLIIPSGSLFISPFTFDEAQNILYASGQGFAMYRVPETNLIFTPTTATVNFNPLPGGFVTALTMSPFTPNRLFIGAGKQLYRLDNANTVTTANAAASMTNIGSASFNGYLNCINFGTTENHIVAVFTNFGVNNVWYTSNGGASWRAIDGNLPDMPVRWAVFEPGSNTKLVIATEFGIYSTDAVNGASTVWMPHLGVPLVRVTMLKARPSDNTIIASTYGRGMFSAIIPAATFPVTMVDFTGKLQGNNIVLNWQTATEQNNKGFEVERSTDGGNFRKIGFVAGAGNSNVLRSYSFVDKDVNQPLYYYRLKQVDEDNRFEYSAIVLVKNPLVNGRMITSLRLSRSNSLEVLLGDIERGNGEIRLLDMRGKLLLRWNGVLSPGSRLRIKVPVNTAAGLYVVQVMQKDRRFSKVVKKDAP